MKPRACLRIGLALLLFVVPSLGGCQSAQTSVATDSTAAFGPGDDMVQTELYFGLGLKDGSSVSPQQWSDFVGQVITPRFPDGLTILSAQGQWRGATGHIEKENSMEVIIIHPASPDRDKAIEEIRDLYKKRFDQESVLRTGHKVHASF